MNKYSEFSVFRVSTSPGKSQILKTGPVNTENPEILLINPETFQNNTQYLFKQETMMIKNCNSQNEFANLLTSGKSSRLAAFADV